MAQLFKTEIVTGTCPTCNEKTLLVGIANSYYQDTGSDEFFDSLEQQVNGVIKYIIADKDTKMALRVDIADDGKEIT